MLEWRRHDGQRSRSRLARYDATGLIWILEGRTVVAMTANEAAMQGRGAVMMFRKAQSLAPDREEGEIAADPQRPRKPRRGPVEIRS